MRSLRWEELLDGGQSRRIWTCKSRRGQGNGARAARRGSPRQGVDSASERRPSPLKFEEEREEEEMGVTDATLFYSKRKGGLRGGRQTGVSKGAH